MTTPPYCASLTSALNRVSSQIGIPAGTDNPNSVLNESSTPTLAEVTDIWDEQAGKIAAALQAAGLDPDVTVATHATQLLRGIERKLTGGYALQAKIGHPEMVAQGERMVVKPEKWLTDLAELNEEGVKIRRLLRSSGVAEGSSYRTTRPEISSRWLKRAGPPSYTLPDASTPTRLEPHIAPQEGQDQWTP